MYLIDYLMIELLECLMLYHRKLQEKKMEVKEKLDKYSEQKLLTFCIELNIPVHHYTARKASSYLLLHVRPFLFDSSSSFLNKSAVIYLMSELHIKKRNGLKSVGIVLILNLALHTTCRFGICI